MHKSPPYLKSNPCPEMRGRRCNDRSFLRRGRHITYVMRHHIHLTTFCDTHWVNNGICTTTAAASFYPAGSVRTIIRSGADTGPGRIGMGFRPASIQARLAFGSLYSRSPGRQLLLQPRSAIRFRPTPSAPPTYMLYSSSSSVASSSSPVYTSASGSPAEYR